MPQRRLFTCNRVISRKSSEYTWDISESDSDFPCTCGICPRRGDWYLRHFAQYFPKKKDRGLSSENRSTGYEDYWNNGFYNSLYDPLNFQDDILPSRCRECNRQYCKYKNMKNFTIPDMLNYSFQLNQQYPKMVTFALPSEWDDHRTLAEQKKELEKKWMKFRKDEIFKHFIPGGVYIYEVTKKVTFDGYYHYPDGIKKVCEPDIFGTVKYHVHVHMIVPLQYLKKDVLKAWSNYSTKFGLGRMNVSSKHKDWDREETRENLTRYLSKYNAKAGSYGRVNRWGSFIGFKKRKLEMIQTDLDLLVP